MKTGNKYMIRLIIISICIILTSTVFSENYYVKNGGNDANSGKSPENAWQTLNKINNFIFSPGDSILFNKGDVWFGQLLPCSGDPSGYITYSSFGKGEKPLLHYSVLLNDSVDWVQDNTNLWRSSQAITNEVGNIIFNNDQLFGVRKWAVQDLITEGDFYYDKNNKKVILNSTINPAKNYSSVRCALTMVVIDITEKSYVGIEGLAIKYSGQDAIRGSNVDHIIVRNVDAAYHGGGELEEQIRFGGGIGFWANASDILIENCRIWENYDAGVTNQSTVVCTQKNIIYRNNIIWNCEYSYEFFNLDENAVTSNIQFINNTCINAGYGWSHNQRPDPSGRHLCFWRIKPNTENIIVQNNIFVQAANYPLFIPEGILTPVKLDYNCWFQTKGSMFYVPLGKKSYSSDEFQTYKSLTGWDKNSLFGDPLLDTFRLTSNSPCIDSGNPDSPLDPDSTIADLGALYFFQFREDSDIIENMLDLLIYPNPSNSTLTIQFKKNSGLETIIELYDNLGHRISSIVTSSQKGVLDISDQPNGLYVVQVKRGVDRIRLKVIISR